MTAETGLSPRQQNICLAVWWLFWICMTIFVVYLVTLPASAVVLSISSHSAGQGVQNLSFVGDLLNISLVQNGTVWNLSLLGAST